MAHAKVECWQQADEILQMEIGRQNRTVNRSTSLVPQAAWDHDLQENTSHIRPAPVSSLLDLNFSLRGALRVNNDQAIDFEGQNHEISTTLCKSVSIVHHPNRKFWVVEHPPKAVWPPILGAFSI